MVYETSKSRALFSDEEKNILQGEGIDIGCGDDPVSTTAFAFDLEQGDANNITNYIDRKFDYIYSSHCLEHMDDPEAALNGWWSLLRDGGYMFLIVPDEDLYEQGRFPSIFNPDHKWTFTIGKNKSWSPRSVNLFQLVSKLPSAKILKIELQDNEYERWIEVIPTIKQLIKLLKIRIRYYVSNKKQYEAKLIKYWNKYTGGMTDQTLKDKTLAQIFFLIKKESA